MRRALRHAILIAAVFGLALTGRMTVRLAVAAQNQQVAEVQQLENEAFNQALAGHFDQTDQILQKAASLSHDPTIEQLANASTTFKAQRDSFAMAQHKQFQELVGQVQLLLRNDRPDYAMDIASRAYSLAEDKDAFRKEAWVRQLIDQSIERARQYDQAEQWIKSLRLYSYLASIEESVPQWKDQLKLATRRVRLLAMYTPDVLRALQDSESKDREQVEKLLHPTTQPATQPANQDAAANDSFRVDWHETLRGDGVGMLWQALVDADQNYYRDISYKEMALGGLRGLRAVATTRGLDKAFPKLADEDRRSEFLGAMDRAEAENQKATAGAQEQTLRNTLNKLIIANRDTIALPIEVLAYEFADGAFERLDPFTSMIWPSDVEEFRKSTEGKFSGVGIQILVDEEGNLKVVSPLEDTPAYRAGVKPGDIITHIDGKIAKNISINQAVRTITGTPGTTVRLTIKSPDANVKEYTFRRETIHVASVKGYLHRPGGGWDYMVDPQQKIGYIRITNFTADTSAELNTAIDTMKLQHVRGIVLDLRYNPGGLLTAATEVADKFLDHGVIVSTKPDRKTGTEPTISMAKADNDDCDLPLLVLVNQYSASASEIVSGALKDDHRAIIVGERTFGKGSVQMLFPLGNDRGAYLKLTTSHYYLPNGRCIHREENSKEWGVDPDLTVRMTPDQMRAAIDVRTDLDVLHDAATAGAEQPKPDAASKVAAAAKPAGPVNKRKELLDSDPQLSAAVLLLRLKLTGAQS